MPTPTNRRLSLAFAVIAALFLVCNVVFYFDGVFRHLLAGRNYSLQGLSLLVNTDNPNFVAILPLSRVVVFGATLLALVWCSVALWFGEARARLVSFFVALGWLAPQTRYLALYLEGFQGFSTVAAYAVSAAVVLFPASLLAAPSVVRSFEMHERSLQWASLPWGRSRLVALGVLLPWLFYVSDAYVATWFWYSNSSALLALSVLAGVLSVVSFVGVVRLRTWGLLTALAAGVSTSAWAWGALQEPTRILGIPSEPGCPFNSFLLAAAPTLLVLAVSWPFYYVMGRFLSDKK